MGIFMRERINFERLLDLLFSSVLLTSAGYFLFYGVYSIFLDGPYFRVDAGWLKPHATTVVVWGAFAIMMWTWKGSGTVIYMLTFLGISEFSFNTVYFADCPKAFWFLMEKSSSWLWLMYVSLCMGLAVYGFFTLKLKPRVLGLLPFLIFLIVWGGAGYPITDDFCHIIYDPMKWPWELGYQLFFLGSMVLTFCIGEKK